MALRTALCRGHQITIFKFPSPTGPQAELAGVGQLEVFHSKRRKENKMTRHTGLTLLTRRLCLWI